MKKRRVTAREEYLLRSVRAWGDQPVSANDVTELVRRTFALTQADLNHLLRAQFDVQLELFAEE